MSTLRSASTILLRIILSFPLVAASACIAEIEDEEGVEEDELRGNGAPSGAHFTLNIIGVPKGKSADLTGNSGHRIFAPLEGSTKILLSEGDFQVLDANGTDGSAAFQLPAPDPDGDGTTSYSVFARALGKPGGSSKTTTCATDPTTGEVFCSVESLLLVRSKGKSTFTNVSRELLSVSADIDGDGTVERVPLFGDGLVDFFWQYDNSGLKLAQLRFVELPTTF
jgi:hypothetical protein